MHTTGHFFYKKRRAARQAIFLTQLIENSFNISRACRVFPMSRQTFYNWRKEPEFDRKYNELIESRHDMVEEALFVSAVYGKDTAAQIFLCKTLLKDRFQRGKRQN